MRSIVSPIGRIFFFPNFLCFFLFFRQIQFQIIVQAIESPDNDSTTTMSVGKYPPQVLEIKIVRTYLAAGIASTQQSIY